MWIVVNASVPEIENQMEENMHDPLSPETQKNLAAARQSFTGKSLSNAQFDTAVALSIVVNRELSRSGKFREVLTDYAHAFARS